METNRKFSGQQFPKQERLTSKKTIEELFTKGSSVFVYPFRLLYLPKPHSTPDPEMYPQVLFSVSKKHFKKAVDRNLIKRRMREAYRLNKSQLLQPVPLQSRPASVALIYIAKEKIEFTLLQKKLKSIWQRLADNHNQASN